jgi:hypothetical protein
MDDEDGISEYDDSARASFRMKGIFRVGHWLCRIAPFPSLTIRTLFRVTLPSNPFVAAYSTFKFEHFSRFQLQSPLGLLAQRGGLTGFPFPALSS